MFLVSLLLPRAFTTLDINWQLKVESINIIRRDVKVTYQESIVKDADWRLRITSCELKGEADNWYLRIECWELEAEDYGLRKDEDSKTWD